ncbi:MAG: hypothetical protein ABUS79_01720 [Pseudomonadota bacterium]
MTAWSVVAALVMLAGCMSQFGVAPAAKPTAGSEIDEVFQSLSAARERAGKKPPGWVPRLAALAHEGAQRLGDGGNQQSIAHDIGNRAAYNVMRNVDTWWFFSDTLAWSEWPPRLLARDGLLVAIGVSLMRTTAPGRHAVFMILLEPGH